MITWPLRAIACLGLVLAAAPITAGCGSRSGKDASTPPPRPACRDDAGDDVEVAARTGVSGAKTGVKTAVEGVKTFGSATAGLVTDGSDEAKARWKKGTANTKTEARQGAAETKQQGHVPRCR